MAGTDPFGRGGSGGSSGPDPFGRSGSSKSGGSDPFRASRGGPVSKAAPAGTNRGFLGKVAHYAGQKLDLAARDLKAIPGGIVAGGQAVAQPFHHPLRSDPTVAKQWSDLLHGHPLRSLHEAEHSKSNSQAANLLAQTAKSTGHTLAHPFADPFATATLLSPIGHGIGKAGIAAKEGAAAARAGEGAAGAAKATAKGLAKRPEHMARPIRSGSSETHLIPSRNAGARVVQAGYDRVLQRGLDRNPEGRVAAHAQKRVGGASKEEARLQQKMRAVPASLLDKAAGKLSKLPGARREEQAALELTSAQTTAEEAARYHRGQAASGVNAKQNLAVARLYDRVGKRGLVKVDESRPAGAKVFIAPVHEALAKTDAALARVQERGDRILVEKGVREGAALESRVNAPGRVRAGAKYEKPTPAKAGIPSQALKREQARSVSLQRRHAGLLEKDAADLAASQNRNLGPLSETDAKTRLAELDKTYDAQVRALVPETSQYSRELQQRETAARNVSNRKVRARRQPTVKSEEFQRAESALLDTIAKYPNHPVAQRMAAVVAERDSLRNALNQRGEAAFAGEKQVPLPSAPARLHASVPAASRPHLSRIAQVGHAIEAQKGVVARMEKAAASRVKPTGLVGGEAARPGRGFVSARISEKKLGKAEASAARGPVVGAAKSPLDAKTFTGRSIEQGLIPKNVTGSASQHFRQITRFVNTDAMRRRALETGSDIRRSSRDVLVRVPDEKAKPLSTTMEQAVGKQKSTVDTAEELATQEGLRAAHDAFLEHLIPDIKSRFANDRAQPVGVPAPEGYRWVDRHALGDLTSPPSGPRGKIARSVDTVNSAITAATVYFKVGHVGTRVLTNAATNIIQGSARPRELGKSATLWKTLDDEQKARGLAAAGQHGFAALPHEGTNLASRVAGKGAQFWARHADAMFRFNALAYEMRRIGYGTPAKFKAALDALESGGHGVSGSEWSKLSAAARRSDREAIAYDRLNDFEKKYITRAVWFYPWIKGSTLFTVRSLIEHPVKGALLGQAGVLGREKQLRTLGPTPSYESGLFKLGGSEANPLVSDFSTFSPFSTAADVLQTPAQPGAVSGFFNPALGAAGNFAYGLDSFGNPTNAPYTAALLALGSPTPEQQFAEALAGRNKSQAGHMFHKTPANVLARYLVGPGLPRNVDQAALAKAAARERSGGR